MLTLQEKINIIENSNSLLDLNKDVLPKVYKEDFYFVSYSHKDYKKVIKDILLLEDMGINIWYDTDMHIGENWEEIAQMYISKFQCKGIIFYLSEASILSNACNKEIEYVLSNNKQFFSINLPIDNNISSGYEMLLKLKEKGYKISNEKLELFKKAFPNEILYLSINDSLERKKDKIEELVGEDLFDFTTCISNGDVGANISLCRDNSLINLNLKDYYQINIESDSSYGEYLPLKEISPCVFTNSYKLRSVVLPDSIIDIGDNAFRNCYNLEYININNKESNIKDYAFSNCKSLNINKINAFDIRNNAFMHCDSLSEIKISALNFGKFSFGYCKSLKKVLFDRVIVTYGAYMFSNCQSLEEIYFKNKIPNVLDSKKLVKLESSMFLDCKSLKNFKLKGKIDINSASSLFAFSGVEKINIDIKNPESIPNNMFSNCKALNNITGTKDFYKYSYSCFKDCSMLEEIDLTNAKIIEEKAFQSTNLKNIDLPNVEKIERYAFSSINNIENIKIGNNLKYIDSSAFDYSNINKLEILSEDLYIDGYHNFSDINPLEITVCNLDLLNMLIDNNDIKTIYIKEGFINEISNYEKTNSDKSGFDKYIKLEANTNDYSKFIDKRVIIETKDDTIRTRVYNVGFDINRNEWYIECFETIYESDIISIEIDPYY